MRKKQWLRPCAATFGAILSFAGCTKIIGGDEYRVADEPRSSVPGSIYNRAECKACLENACGDELQACRDDPVGACATALECLRGCSDPSCASSCRSPVSAQRNENEPFKVLLSCTKARCKDDCPLGTNFACVERYDVPAPYVGRTSISTEVDVNILPFVLADDVTAHACLPGAVRCNPEEARAPVEAGRVTLTVPLTDPTGFKGAFFFTDDRLDAGPSDGGSLEGPLLPSYLVQTLPYREDQVRYIGIPTLAYCNSQLSAVAESCDSNRAYLYVAPGDCESMYAVGVEIELNTADERTKIRYFESNFAVSQTLTATAGWAAVISHAPPIAAQLVAREVGTRREVSRAEVVPTAGSFTRVNMLPTPRR